jgi:hypothetical protein
VKKNQTPSTALVPLNTPLQRQAGKTGLPAVTARLPVTTGRLPVKSGLRQPFILEREPSVLFSEFDDPIRPRSRRRYRRSPAEAAIEPANVPYDPLRRTTEQALDYLLTPQLKRFLRYAAIASIILLLADLLSGSGSGTACGVSVIQSAYPMPAGEVKELRGLVRIEQLY